MKNIASLFYFYMNGKGLIYDTGIQKDDFDWLYAGSKLLDLSRQLETLCYHN